MTTYHQSIPAAPRRRPRTRTVALAAADGEEIALVDVVPSRGKPEFEVERVLAGEPDLRAFYASARSPLVWIVAGPVRVCAELRRKSGGAVDGWTLRLRARRTH